MRVIAAIALVSWIAAQPCRGAAYQIIDLGTLGGDQSSASDVNNLAQVVGFADLPDGTHHAFLYSGGPLQDLGTLGGAYSSASAINDNGQIAGTAWNSDKQNRAFRYSGGPLQDLGTLASGAGNHRLPSSQGSAINSLGQVVGTSHVDDVTYHPFFYDAGPMQDLAPAGPSANVARAINTSGQIAGSTPSAGWIYDGTFHDLGSLGGGGTQALGMNEAGVVVGYSYLSDQVTYRGFIYSGGPLMPLGTLGGSGSQALDINALGQVVGGSHIALGSDVFHGFLYSDGVMTDLNDLVDPALGWEILKGTAINDHGQIVGWGIIDGNTHAYLMTPVPEPSSLFLVTLGLVSFVGWALRTKRRAPI